MAAPNEEFWYPTLEDVLAIHDDIVSEDRDSEPGVENRERIQYALDHVEHGHFGEGPETVHEKAFHLMRLLASNHWFVDGNKRTALNTTEVFYLFNGYEFDYGEDIRSMLKLLAVREGLIDPDVAIEFFSEKVDLIHFGPGTGKTHTMLRFVTKIQQLRSPFDEDSNDQNG